VELHAGFLVLGGAEGFGPGTAQDARAAFRGLSDARHATPASREIQRAVIGSRERAAAGAPSRQAGA
jgi:hypothetical protein